MGYGSAAMAHNLCTKYKHEELKHEVLKHGVLYSSTKYSSTQYSSTKYSHAIEEFRLLRTIFWVSIEYRYPVIKRLREALPHTLLKMHAPERTISYKSRDIHTRGCICLTCICLNTLLPLIEQVAMHTHSTTQAVNCYARARYLHKTASI